MRKRTHRLRSNNIRAAVASIIGLTLLGAVSKCLVAPVEYGPVRVSAEQDSTASSLQEPPETEIPSSIFYEAGIFPFGPREWWIRRSTAGPLGLQFGNSGDKVVPGDFTGDGKTDVAIWRPSTGQRFVVRSEDGSFFGFPFGTDGDVPVPGDYDVDGRFDAAVFRPSSSTWFIGRTTAGTQIVQFGTAADKPIPAAFIP